MKVQYIPEKLLLDNHRITVIVIGAGGTGSILLNQLARIHTALVGLGKKGIHVRCLDNDIVSESNLGRQLFTEADIGLNKADVLISKINMFYGLDWDAYNERYDGNTTNCLSNFNFLCVDNVTSRNVFYESIKKKSYYNHENAPYYVIDCGNDFNTGQVYLSNGIGIEQPKSKYKTIKYLPNPIKKFGKSVYSKKEKNTPSCSLAQAIGKQDLMINQFVADCAAKMFWDIVRNLFISYNVVFINLSEMKIIKNKL